MLGAIIQIKNTGIQDTLLIGNPEYNFIKQVYKQYINFAIEETRLLPNEMVNFGNLISIDIKNLGDFLYKLWFCFTLPRLVSTSGTYSGWTNSIGHTIIEHIDIEINYNRIDRVYGLFLEIWNEMTTHRGPADIVIGKYSNISSLTQNATNITNYKVPLRFWFTENIGSALPLLQLKNQSVKIWIKLRSFSECVVFDGITPPLNVTISNAYLLSQYIFIDDNERKKYIGQEHSFLIEQLQSTYQDINQTSIYKCPLIFNHPVKEILFILRDTQSEVNNDWFNFSLRNTQVHTQVLPLLNCAKLVVDGKDRSEYKSSDELSIVNPSIYHSNVSDKFIYSMPFCSDPEKFFPTGSFNFSTITSSFLQLQTNNTTFSKIYVFARNYNWITIKHLTNTTGSTVSLKYSV
jgi:hypothetical protein